MTRNKNPWTTNPFWPNLPLEKDFDPDLIDLVIGRMRQIIVFKTYNNNPNKRLVLTKGISVATNTPRPTRGGVETDRRCSDESFSLPFFSNIIFFQGINFIYKYSNISR